MMNKVCKYIMGGTVIVGSAALKNIYAAQLTSRM